MEYVTGPRDEECFLCRAASSEDPEAELVLARRDRSLVILNRYPYNAGHLMVVPLRHIADLEDLTDEERLELMQLSAESVAALKKVFSPEGFNLGANLGAVAGAGLPGHFHIHVVPRWEGDTNFMPVTAGTKILPETLEESFDRLRSAFS